MSDMKSIGLQILDFKFPQRINWYSRESIKNENLDYKLFLFFVVARHCNIVNKIRLIKIFRLIFDASLRDSKNAVEQIYSNNFLDFKGFNEIVTNENSLKYIKEYEKTMIKTSADAYAKFAKFLLSTKKYSQRDDYENLILSMKSLLEEDETI